MFLSGAAFKLIIVAAVGLAGFVAGIKLEGNRWRAKEADRLEAMLKERQVDESFTQGVSVAYEQVAAQLRRITTVNRVELTREVQKVEYRCPVPDDAIKLLNDAINAANHAASGKPDATVPADPAPVREGSGGTDSGILGAYERIRGVRG